MVEEKAARAGPAHQQVHSSPSAEDSLPSWLRNKDLLQGYAYAPRGLKALSLSLIHILKTQVIQSIDLEMIKAIKCTLLPREENALVQKPP